MRRRARDEGARGRAGGRLGSPRSPAPLERPSDAAGWPSRCVTSRTSPSQLVPTRGVEGGVERRPENARGTFSDLSEKAPDLVFRWWRGQDLNLRPSGYEPDELPDCSTPRRTDDDTDRRHGRQPGFSRDRPTEEADSPAWRSEPSRHLPGHRSVVPGHRSGTASGRGSGSRWRLDSPSPPCWPS